MFCRAFFINVVAWCVIVGDPANADLKNYENYKIYELTANNYEGGEKIQEFYKDKLGELFPLRSRFSTDSRRNMLSLLVGPEQEELIKEFLENNSATVKMRIINSNVPKSVQTARGNPPYAGTIRPLNEKFKHYLRYDEIVSYLMHINRTYEHMVYVDVFHRSAEGRKIYSVYISKNMYKTSKRKPTILLDATFHGRDWITTATALYIIDELLTHAKRYQNELTYFDWMILPVVNPDGYEYSHEVDRFWQKSRRRNVYNSSDHCVGTNLNRNFEIFWGVEGASMLPCSCNYAGFKPLSEPETMAVATIFKHLKKQFRMYLTLHSYGNYILYPYHHNYSLPRRWRKLHEIALAGSKAIERRTGTNYEVGSLARVLHPTSGTSDNFVYVVKKIPVALTMKLPSGDDGLDPPPDRIAYVVEEAWTGIQAMVGKAHQLGEFQNGVRPVKTKVPAIIWLPILHYVVETI